MKRISAIALSLLISAHVYATQRQVVNVNTASAAQLCYLPGIGVSLAANIIAARPFKQVPDLMRVKGIKEKKLAKLQKFVSFSGPTTITQKIVVPKIQ
jgi:DNA uptake protein ComE-like DNA-binding protein